MSYFIFSRQEKCLFLCEKYSTIGKLWHIDRTNPHPRWVLKHPCPSPKGEGRDVSDSPPRIEGSSGQCHTVLLILYP